jgi:lipid A disaccharide synthetase
LLGPALLRFLEEPQRVAAIRTEYAEIHRRLRRNAGREAAAAVLDLIGGGRA